MANPETKANQPTITTQSGGLFYIPPEKRGSTVRALVVVVLALVAFGAVIFSYVQQGEVYSEISAATTQLSELQSENVQMQTKLEGQASISSVKEYAEDYLGMQKLDNSQIQYINIQTEDEIILDEQSQNIFVRIKHAFQNLLAYLRG